MNIEAMSVGRIPLVAIQVTLGISTLMLGALWWHTHRYGPSVIITGLKDPTMLPLHRDDGIYAQAIASRFVHEYWNWSYTGMMQAKARAAYFCNPQVGAALLREARSVDHFYRELLDTCNGNTDLVETAWSRPQRSHYLIHVHVVVQEWQSFTHTTYPEDGYIEVRPIAEQGDRQFRMEVVRYAFQQATPPQHVDEVASDDPFDRLLEQARDLPATLPTSTPTHVTHPAPAHGAPRSPPTPAPPLRPTAPAMSKELL